MPVSESGVQNGNKIFGSSSIIYQSGPESASPLDRASRKAVALGKPLMTPLNRKPRNTEERVQPCMRNFETDQTSETAVAASKGPDYEMWFGGWVIPIILSYNKYMGTVR